jgi:hypothetical protein
MHWRMGFLLFLIMPAVFAVQPIDLTFAVPGVALIVVVLLAATSMMATAMSNSQLEAWAKTEVREFLAALLLIGIIVGLFISSNGVSVALTGQSDYVGASQAVLDEWIAHFDSAFEDIFVAASRIRTAATYSPYMNIPLWYVSISYSTNPIGGVGILLGTLNAAAGALTNAIFIGEGMRMLIGFIRATFPTIILPLAFCLRLIPFTRKSGNTLISIALAGLVFLPFSVILADSLNDLIDYPNPSINYSNLDADPWAMVAFEGFCEVIPVRVLLQLTDVLFALVVCLPLLLTPWTAGFYPVCYNLVKEVVYPLINVLFQVGGSALLIIWEAVFSAGALDYLDDVWGELYPFFRDVNNLVLISYIDYILIAIVTISGARSISAALGGEWYMAGVQRLI